MTAQTPDLNADLVRAHPEFDQDWSLICDALDEANRFFANRDEMNAAVHCTGTRWSPVTELVRKARAMAYKMAGTLNDNDEVLLRRLAELWSDQLALGTTQGGGRRYTEHCDQHAEARQLLQALHKG